MALDGTNSGLVASVGAWLNRSDLAPYIPDFIKAAEAQISRRLVAEGGVRQMFARADAGITGEFCNLPADFLAVRSVYTNGANTPSGIIKLKYATPDQINDLKAYHSLSDSPCPTHFTIVGNAIQFWPWNGIDEDTSFLMELTYLQAIPPLASNDNNWLIVSNPDVYLYTALLQTAPFLKNDARVQVWGTFATQIVQDIIAADKVSRTGDDIAIPMRPAGCTP